MGQNISTYSNLRGHVRPLFFDEVFEFFNPKKAIGHVHSLKSEKSKKILLGYDHGDYGNLK